MHTVFSGPLISPLMESNCQATKPGLLLKPLAESKNQVQSGLMVEPIPFFKDRDPGRGPTTASYKYQPWGKLNKDASSFFLRNMQFSVFPSTHRIFPKSDPNSGADALPLRENDEGFHRFLRDKRQKFVMQPI
jgi:hypothetical protein